MRVRGKTPDDWVIEIKRIKEEAKRLPPSIGKAILKEILKLEKKYLHSRTGILKDYLGLGDKNPIGLSTEEKKKKR